MAQKPGHSVGVMVLGALAFGMASSAVAQTETGCRLPGNAMIKATTEICAQLGGSPEPTEASAGDVLYGIWKSNNRTKRERAYAAAESYVKSFPDGGHVEELRAWANAYETVMKPEPPPPPVAPQPAAAAGSDTKQIELAFWQSIETSTDPADFQDYLHRYPEGSFASLAKRKVATLEKPATPAAPPAPHKAKAESRRSHASAKAEEPPPEIGPPPETVTIDGTTYIKGREPKGFRNIPAPP